MPHVRLLRHVARLVVDSFAYAARLGASTRRAAHHTTRHAARRQLLCLRRASGCLGTSRSSSSTTSPPPRVRVPRHVAWLVTWLVIDYFASATRPGASARHAAHQAARRRLLHLAQARHRLLHLRCASGCLGTSSGSLSGSSSTTSPRAGSSSTTSPMPHVWLLRHVVRLVASLIVDYFASRRLVVDNFDYAAHPGASACRAARHSARLAARRRLLRLRRTSGCFGMSCGLSRDSSLTTSPRASSSSNTSPMPRVRVPRHVAQLVTRLVVDYFDYATRPGASACRAARLAARRRLLHLRHTSGCFGTSRGLSRDSSSTTSPRAGSSSTTSPTPRVWVPRHIARHVTRLVVDYFDHAARPGSLSTTSPTPRVRVPRHVAQLVTWLVVDYFDYAIHPGASACHTARLAARR
jgi:hypothetical protein